MKKIQKIETITSIYYNWKPSDLAFIKSLEWTDTNLLIIFYCQLRNSVNGWPDMSKDFFEVSITFKKISGLKLDFNDTRLHQITGFDIFDISDRGFEKFNFEIEDYENGTINFYCEEVEINSITNPIAGERILSQITR